MSTRETFIELDRTFSELQTELSVGEELESQLGFKNLKSLSWVELLANNRIVILSEAGSGKTLEIRKTAENLRAFGKIAFFLRLENIPSHFEHAFEVGTNQEFNNWLISNDKAWLLFDSIDEARLNDPKDFELAIKIIANTLGGALSRTHIIITGRTTAWRSISDLNLCDKWLPGSSKLDFSNSSTDDEDLTQNISVKDTNTPTSQFLHDFKVVTLNELNQEQVKIFAIGTGLSDPQDFIDAVDRVDGWSFTTRPQDLLELLEYWKDKKEIGGRFEIIQNSIERRLTERDENRSLKQSLSNKKLRQGASLLAAAVTLTHETSIHVPGSRISNDGIDLKQLMPEWNPKELDILLTRPIFDAEIYGRVRFHHRLVREFLTAEWIKNLLETESSRRNVEALLFQKQYGIDVVVPTFRPILPWLAIEDENIRVRLLNIAPEILLEGGDPSRMPIEIRQKFLNEICQKIAINQADRFSSETDVIQRFAKSDLAPDINQLLHKYQKNNDVLWFLLRMIWIGKLKGTLLIVKKIAQTKTLARYTRITAFKALHVIASETDVDEIRSKFLQESKALNREWLSSLVENLQPSSNNTRWLFKCLAKAELQNRNAIDLLADRITEYVERMNNELQFEFIDNINSLLTKKPYVDNRYCDISSKFNWLLYSAAKSVEKLVAAKDQKALHDKALHILRMTQFLRSGELRDHHNEELKFNELVPSWNDLNRTLFWYQTESERQLRAANESIPTEFWQISTLTYCKYGVEDFDYAISQIADRTLIEEKLLALSLAYHLYAMDKRKRSRKQLLVRAVSGIKPLETKLSEYLGQNVKRDTSHKRLEAKINREQRVWERKNAKDKEKAKNYLAANIDLIRNGPANGKIRNAQCYLYDQSLKADESSIHRSHGNWQFLATEYGYEVAKAYRDGTVGFWRNYQPTLVSEGDTLGACSYRELIGLSGIQIEATETPNWPTELSPRDIETATRYALHEINGFPTWFPKVYANNPGIVGNILMKEITHELSHDQESTDSSYALYDISREGKWSWDDIAPKLFEILQKLQLKSAKTLGNVLTIIQGSKVSDLEVAELASDNLKTCNNLKHAVIWYAVWIGVEPAKAIKHLEKYMDKIKIDTAKTEFAMQLVTHLAGRFQRDCVTTRDQYRKPIHLKELYLMMNRYISVKNDINRVGQGAYSPGLRDEAQDARNNLGEMIKYIPGKEAFTALAEIAVSHPDKHYKMWYANLAKQKATSDAECDKWTTHQVHQFDQTLQRSPKTHRELANLIHMRLLDLKDDIEEGDNSNAIILQKASEETELRNYVSGELRKTAHGRYSVANEDELADSKRPDIRINGNEIAGAVPCELKIANKWTWPKLINRLEQQLVGDYLRDQRSSRGFFLLINQKNKTWKISQTRRVQFKGLIQALNDYWLENAFKYPKIEQLYIIGIDLIKRTQ